MRLFHLFLPLLALGMTARSAPPGNAAAAATGFNGVVVTSRGDAVQFAAYGTSTPAGGGFRRDDLWRWASVTKQIVATLVMQQVAAGRIDLDKPVAAYLPAFAGPTAGRITVRQLLRHQSGLPDPSGDAANPPGKPGFYAPDYAGSRDPLTGFCAGPVAEPPGGTWRYNNCDYIVAGALLEQVTGRQWTALVAERIARPLKLRTLAPLPRRRPTVAGYEDGKPEQAQDIAAYAASASLSGTVDDLWRFDRALMTGRLLPEAARATMWDGQPKLGFIALGQWVFTVPLKGCAAPVRIVERRGAIGGVEVRNFILPDRDVVVIAFTNRAGFAFGEVWQGKGFSHDLLAAAACP